jgi:predicted small secreted protein
MGRARRRRVVIALLLSSVLLSGCDATRDALGAGDAASPEATRSPAGPPPGRAPCHRGTRDLGLHRVYDEGSPHQARLCAVPGFTSSDDESTPGDPYYVRGAKGRVIVHTDISRQTLQLFRFAARNGIHLQAASSFRTHRHQRATCRQNEECRSGDHTFVAPPGWSHHQTGTAIDVIGTYVEGTQSCGRGRARDPGSEVWAFMEKHARDFGFRQYAAESWHWDASGAEDRC